MNRLGTKLGTLPFLEDFRATPTKALKSNRLCRFNGGPGGIRTPNQGIMSPLL